MNTTKITLNNKEFTLDIDRAKELGVLKEEYKFRSGDVFRHRKAGITCVFIQTYCNKEITCLGLDGSLVPWSNTKETPESVKQNFFENYSGDWVYKGNISDKFRDLLKSL